MTTKTYHLVQMDGPLDVVVDAQKAAAPIAEEVERSRHQEEPSRVAPQEASLQRFVLEANRIEQRLEARDQRPAIAFTLGK